MQPRIYQSFFQNFQKSTLDPLFFPLDNTENKTPLLREYPLLKKCFSKSIEDNIELWGMFSWKFYKKLNLNSKKIFQMINENPNKDVYFFNPFYGEVIQYYNIWEQGEANHKNMIKIIEEIFPLLNLDLNKIYDPMCTDIMFFCCNIVANNKFWSGFFNIYENYFDVLNKINFNIREMHDKSAGYKAAPELNFFPFIHERFFSHYININNFNVFSYHHDDKRRSNKNEKNLHYLKKEAILEKNKTKLKKWVDTRDSMYHLNLSNYFYDKCSW